jgi:hypothetical protein
MFAGGRLLADAAQELRRVHAGERHRADITVAVTQIRLVPQCH